MTIRTIALALAAATILSPVAAAAQGKDDKSVSQSNADRLKDEAEAAYANAPVAEAETKHRDAVTIGGRRYGYTASAGTLTIRDIEGKPTASMFYTAYTLDGVKPGTKRPVTFLYNGAPGSPSFWLRMGSFAPSASAPPIRSSSGPRPTMSGPTPIRCSTRPTSSSSTRSAPATRARWAT